MGGLTGAVHWWEESQLRVLVLTSLCIQFFLIFFPYLRRRAIHGWLRFIMWLTYHGSDAVAIYALATLFNRHRREGDGGGGGGGSNTLLQVVWAPVLLIHLGGQDGVTAYSIEDNELWSRHLLTAVSQVTVAVYVFCKSWPRGGDDNKLLAAAILLFVVGFVKCFAKARAFKRASIYSLVSSGAAAKQENDDNMYNNTLNEYVEHATRIVIRQQPEDHHHQVKVMDEEDPGTATTTSGVWALEVMRALPLRALLWARRLSSSKDETAEGGSSNHPRPRRLRGERAEASNNNPTQRRQENERLFEEHGEVSKLFVDLSSSYPHRISIFEKVWGLRQQEIRKQEKERLFEERVEVSKLYDSVRGGLASAFLLLYTKLKTALPENSYKHTGYEAESGDEVSRICIQGLRTFVPLASIALFHHSHREAYNGIDVKVTYAILCCTAVLETYSSFILFFVAMDIGPEVWPETVDQYSLAGYFVRNKKHSIKMWIVSVLQCKDFLDQLWCMEPCFTSARITDLVLRYLEDGWKQIQNAASYRSFNNHSSHWGLNMKNRPFDECVLLWHLATDFCFFSTTSFPDHRCTFAEPPAREPPALKRLIVHMFREMVQPGECTSSARNPTSTTTMGPECSQKSAVCKAVQCRQMSNYMVYLLFVNPEMLLPGSRRHPFKAAYDELKDILRDWEWNPVCWSRCTPCGVKLIEEEAIVMKELIAAMEKRAPTNEAIVTDTVITVTQPTSEEENFIDQAWALAQRLRTMDEMKMWEVIQDVWVEMLCFSASRCRGYLHAKALGKGGELLSYVWLVLFYMGMETFTDKLQRVRSHESGNHAGTAPPSTSEGSTTGHRRRRSIS